MDEADVLIRPAVPEDGAALTELCCSSSSYRGRYARLIATVMVDRHYLERHRVFVAVAERTGEMLGFYAVVEHPPELDLFFVADDAQGVGLGTRLARHMFDRARRAGLPGLRVVAHPPAESFYLRLGARRVGTVPPRPPLVTWPRPDLWFDLPKPVVLMGHNSYSLG